MIIKQKSVKIKASSAEQIVKAQDKLNQTKELLIQKQTEIDTTNEQLNVVVENSHVAILSYEKLIENEQEIIRKATAAKEKNNVYKAKLSEVLDLEV